MVSCFFLMFGLLVRSFGNTGPVNAKNKDPERAKPNVGARRFARLAISGE